MMFASNKAAVISAYLTLFHTAWGGHHSLFTLNFSNINWIGVRCTANILTVLSTAFGSVTFPTVLWLCMLLPKTAIDLKLYSSMSLSVTGTAVGCDHYYQITVGNVTQPMTVNWL